MGAASQPLHGSILADGDPSRTVERHHPKTGETETVKFGEGVHSTYETAVLALKAHELRFAEAPAMASRRTMRATPEAFEITEGRDDL